MPNKLFGLYGLFLICLPALLQSQSLLYKGEVIDAHTQKSLVFVSISKNDNSGGTISDLDGLFSIEANIGDTLKLSYVGYAVQNLVLGKKQFIQIQLHPSTATLQEVVVRPKENPAWRIIRAVQNHRQQNDPNQYKAYHFSAYHKTVMAIDSLSADYTWKPKKAPKKEGQRKAFERSARIRHLFKDSLHFWVSESYTENYFRHPSQNKEITLAHQSSMPNDIAGGINPINFQPFGFYQDLIRLEFTNQNYVNPISQSSFQHYDFELKDTLFHSIDTTFVIAFKPLKGQFFFALEGLLYINTNGYAIENVIAVPADKNQTIQFEIQQQSALINGRWFPQQLHTDLFIEMRLQDRFIQYAFRNRSLIEHIDYTIPDSILFNHYLKENASNPLVPLDSLRLIPLSEQEQNTYTHWDSLNELRGFYRFLKLYNGLIKIGTTGLLEGKHINLVVTDLAQNNQQEGWRLGLGLQTSDHLFKHHSFYTYAAYGLLDEKVKYGLSWDIELYPKRGLRLRTIYKKDVLEPGQSPLLKAVNQPWTGINGRRFTLSRLDDRQESRLELFYRPHFAWQLNAFVSDEIRRPTYVYHYSPRQSEIVDKFKLREIGIRIRWSPKEKLIKMGQIEALLYPSFPIVDLSVTHGQFTHFSLSFTKIRARIQHELRWKYLGITSINLEGGYIDQPLPYPYLFQMLGNKKGGIITSATFNTAGVTEFVNQQYAAAFINHNFGYLLGKIDKTPWFRPELNIAQNIGWGRSYADFNQHAFALKDFSNVYLESGIGLKNILRLPYFNVAYFGLGGIVFYRWGAYHLDQFQENLFFQFQLSLSI